MKKIRTNDKNKDKKGESGKHCLGILSHVPLNSRTSRQMVLGVCHGLSSTWGTGRRSRFSNFHFMQKQTAGAGWGLHHRSGLLIRFLDCKRNKVEMSKLRNNCRYQIRKSNSFLSQMSRLKYKSSVIEGYNNNDDNVSTRDVAARNTISLANHSFCCQMSQ